MSRTIPAALRGAAAVLALIASALMLTGCTAPADDGLTPANSVGVVMPLHDFSPQVTENGLRAVIEKTVQPDTLLAIYSSEGKPQQLWSGIVTYDESSGKVVAARKDAIDEILEKVMAFEAISDGNDPLEAVMLIGRDFKERDGTKTIVVLDTLLQTSGTIQLQDGSLYGEPSDTVEYLTDSGYLGTDLKGVTVVLTQTGAVAPGSAQPVLDSSALKRLDRLWSAVFSAASATVTHATVEFAPAEGPFPHNEIVPVAPVTAQPAGCRIPMTGAQLNFLPDSADFVDSAASAEAIAAAAEQLKAAGCSGEVVLIGTTSSAGNAAGRERLSYDRADAVRSPLARALSLPNDEIAIVAAGYDERYCAHDRDAGNRLIPGLASACRQVIITIGSSD